MPRRYHLERVAVRMVLPRARVSIVLGARVATHPAVWIAMGVLGGPILVRLGAVEHRRRSSRP